MPMSTSGAPGADRYSERHTVLYLVETPGQFTELERLTQLLAGFRDVEQIYLVYDCGEAKGRIAARIAELKAELANASVSTATATLRGAAGAQGGLGRFVRYLRDLVHQPVFAARFRRLLKRRGVDLVVVAEDSAASRSRALVAAAERLRLPVLLLPFSVVNPNEAAASLRQLPNHRIQGWMRRAFAALRPNWVRRDHDNELLRLPLGKAVVLELARLAPEYPWIENRGPAVIAVESKAMQRRYRALGISESQLVSTGSLVDDVLENVSSHRTELRAALLQRFSLSDKPLLLCALPPDQFRLGVPPECAYQQYAHLLADWLTSLKAVAKDFAIVVRPHPRVSSSDLAQLTESGLQVVWDDTASLIPLCDCYLASSSATIRWAIACARPVLNYDVYRYHYDDYKGLGGVVTVDSAQDFNAALIELASNPPRLNELAGVQAGAAGDWGNLDGKSRQRMLALCDDLMSRR